MMERTIHKSALSKELSDKVTFLSFIIPQFAEYCKMTIPEAYRYLKKYDAPDFLSECWWALHTDSDFWAVHSIYEYCYNGGGTR
jgi:hypothetical protein